MASLNSVTVNGDTDKEVPVFGKINFLQPQDSRQYLFSLTPRNDLRTNYKQLRGATNIGKFENITRYDFLDFSIRQLFIAQYSTTTSLTSRGFGNIV
jgi:hypothetical protein